MSCWHLPLLFWEADRSSLSTAFASRSFMPRQAVHLLTAEVMAVTQRSTQGLWEILWRGCLTQMLNKLTWGWWCSTSQSFTRKGWKLKRDNLKEKIREKTTSTVTNQTMLISATCLSPGTTLFQMNWLAGSRKAISITGGSRKSLSKSGSRVRLQSLTLTQSRSKTMWSPILTGILGRASRETLLKTVLVSQSKLWPRDESPEMRSLETYMKNETYTHPESQT